MQFLIARGYLEGDFLLQLGDQFQDDYINGRLNLDDYIAFVSKSTQCLWPDKLADVQIEYLAKAHQMMLPAAFDLLARHQQRGDYTMIITATNDFIARGIADAFGVDSFMATMLDINQNGFTGKIRGTPCFREGKLTLLKNWLNHRPQFSLERTWFYSDSHNDLPLLKSVAMPVAVDPDDTLRCYATEHDWRVVSLRDSNIMRIPYEQDSIHIA